MLTECFLLGLLGGLGALIAAGWAFSAPVLLHPESLPRMSTVQLDTTVFAFNLGLVLFTTFVVGAIPAIRISRTGRAENLKEGARQSDSAGRYKSRAVLVVTEVALATILMVGAGLLIRSFQQLLAVDPGFRAEQLLTTRLTLPAERYPDMPKRAEFFRQLKDELATEPGVISAAAINTLPMSGHHSDWYLTAEGYEPADPNADYIQFRCVTPDYFETLGIPLVRGRTFTNHDIMGSQPVVILSESLARRFWGDEDPIGRRVRQGRQDSSDSWFVVVGIVAEVHHSGARRGEVPMWYRSAYQHIWSSMSLAVRTTGDPAQAIGVVKDAVSRVDPYQPIYGTQVMTEMVSISLSDERLNTNLLMAFAGLALGLATIGIYGVIAYSVSRRTQEIGMRMALGAPRGRVLRDVLGDGLKLVLAGLGIGVVVALVLTQFLRWLLFGVEAYDPITFFGVVLVLGTIGLLACLLPARRASRVDPLVALRYE
jgi:putative ABC transport system permease protein